MTNPVSITKCASYDLEEVRKAVLISTDDLGGFDSFLDKGDKVLLKPNLLQARPPEDMVTTHPQVLEAVILEVKEFGGIPMVGDSSGGLASGMKEYWEVSGLEEVCRRHDVRLLNFEKLGSYHKIRNDRDYYISKPVLDCDLLINLPKIKTHRLTVFTCAVKNMYGSVPGFTKVEYHKKAPQPSEFAKLVVDIYALTQPNLNIVDGVVGMEGNGPSSGDPRDLGMILAGENGVSMDSLICHILGKEPLKVPTNSIAGEQGLGETDVDEIKVLGDIPVIKNFKWPQDMSRTLEFIPGPLARGLMKYFWTRPAIDPDKCNKCAKCVESCPTKAVKCGVDIPEFNYPECINCWCCMEMCPQKAVYTDKSLVYRIGSRFSKSRD
ncbi:MAG TPA: DUF362 domain-containing protein [Methanobacteriaceae archaeon]|nr:DUF362 domain-containing protein [Methanobacteriaceae archaeon]